MLVTGWVVIKCLPVMWKDWLEHRRLIKELTLKTRSMDLKLAEKVDRITRRGEPKR